MKINIKQSLLALVAVPALALSVASAPVFALDVTGGVDAAKGDKTPNSLFGEDGSDNGIFKTIVNVILYIIGAIAVIMLIIGGVRYTISQGDSSAVTSAKNTILYSIIGLVVAILAYAIVNFVLDALITT